MPRQTQGKRTTINNCTTLQKTKFALEFAHSLDFSTACLASKIPEKVARDLYLDGDLKEYVDKAHDAVNRIYSDIPEESIHRILYQSFMQLGFKDKAVIAKILLYEDEGKGLGDTTGKVEDLLSAIKNYREKGE